MDQAWETAIRRGDADVVHERLAAGADVNARDQHGQTGLMLAAHLGHVAVAEALMAADADLDVSAKYNLTALMLAIIAGHEDLARAILAAGADLTPRGSGAPGFADKTAHDLAVARGFDALAAVLRPESRT